MKKFTIATATEARAHFAKMLKLAEQGEEVIITHRPDKEKDKEVRFKLTVMPGKDDALPHNQS